MMKMTSLMVAIAMSLSAGSAIAACPDKSASNTGTDAGQTAGISKDGTHAPLETPKAMGNANKPAAKDGTTMPLAGAEGGGDKNLATSQQDIEAQQHGDKAAAAKADENCKD
ncbi:hypothetical protein EN962_26180 [Mesorhizobium sp. M7A.F.Ca.CA.001.09.2.1]|uniref:Exopolysaccharide production protein YjbE n=3 Tax=Mesorhizobium TaxID=68287 RepID=E8T7R3_MESCW|nr:MULTISPECIES: hypothetical protein [Mesorhizobium]RUY26155.1 hypothetical protein EN981_33245 [Mesorhizobium sp. M7A.F.Ca.CA.001.13.2.1]RUY74606.1 hypothetical protein EN962_26180 [Mesorhizobium sp. M7A.F.Ca.CA.001.09.2.1]RUZ87166.1 hypothetical protein EN947_10485 [Mesorhizobium sp. M7A.F.Ca.US.003.02.2.1]RVA33817.1 hypothetical protein EN933_31410 [Mesorhizobium sp. M7A.F.Ca.US.001.01.1.1]ADV12914.1 hypothetical protein Mesci_3797 [Mesorhizobium ciceri biovar biserrulae WSM1271]